MTTPVLSAAALAEAHRGAQASNLAALAALIVRYFGQIRPDDLPGTSRLWLAAVIPLIAARRRESSQLAAAYYGAARLVDTGSFLQPSLRPEIVDLNVEQATRSLAITGPAALKARLDRGVPLQTALDQSASGSAASAVRLVGDGGRQTLLEEIKADSKAFGWVRVTRANPCYFCAMLASRGPVYKGDSFSDSDPRFEGGFGSAKVHDSCQCFLAPVFDRKAPLPGRVAEFESLWRSSTAGHSGKDAVNAFRRAYSG